MDKCRHILLGLILSAASSAVSYRNASKKIQEYTNETISHEAVRDVVFKAGEIMEKNEDEEISGYAKNQLVQGKKEVKALFEEADGLWINLQGKDRNEQLERLRKQKEKKGEEFNPRRKVKTELKLHVTYEGHKAEDKRHTVLNKRYIAGIMKPKRLEKIRDARVYQEYNTEKIELRVLNGDGAQWINKIATNGIIAQKDQFHIKQEIVRVIKNEEAKQKLFEMLENKEYSEVLEYIEKLKYETTGEEREVKKLDHLKQYLSTGLERYQDVLEKQGKHLPEAPEGVEYRKLGIMESQIFSVLKVRLTSGRKSFSKIGASHLSKVCAKYYENEGKIEIEEVVKRINIDTSDEDWIKEIEEKIKENKHKKLEIKKKSEAMSIKNIVCDLNFMKELAKHTSVTDLVVR